MGTTTANMSLQKPTLERDPGTWDDQINASLEILDAHTHGPGSGVQLAADGLNITTDLTLHGTAALIASKAIAFETQASYTTIHSLWVKTSDGELYWRNGSGTDVKMTSGGTLNIAIVGGIVGDYASASAAVYYDDAAQAYRFLEAAPLPNSWSRVQCGDLDLYQHASGIANRVRLSSPAALAASYDLTLPAALPASKCVVQMSAIGAISATPGDAVAIGGAITAGSTLAVTGLITATAGVTAAVNQHVTVSGTGRFKHGDEELFIHASAFQSSDATSLYNQTGYHTGVGGVSVYAAPLLLPVGRRVQSIIFYYNVNSTGAGIQPRLRRQDFATGTQADVTAGTSDSTGSAFEGQTITPSHTIVTGYAYFLEVTVTNASHRVHGAKVTYDLP